MGILKQNCRLCQVRVGTIPLQDDLCQVILEVTNIKVNDDNVYQFLPTSICSECNIKILETHLYIKDVQRVNQYLNDCLENSNYQKINALDPIIENSEHKDDTFACNMCPNIFTIKEELQNHLLDHICKTGRFACTVCFKRSKTKSNYEKHKKLHSELYCAKCRIFFDDQEQSENHVSNILHKGRKRATVRLRIKTETAPGRKLEEQTTCEDSKNGEITSKNQFQCKKCSIDYEDELDYAAHIEAHHKFTCNEENCSKVFTALSSLKAHGLIHESKKPYLCVSCGKEFRSKKSLVCHEKTHSEIKGYKCESCNLYFSVSSNLRAHIKKYHEFIRFHCSQCPREFMSKCTLERHEKIHIGVKDFICEECTSAFYTKKELVKHQRYHQGLRLHKCEICFKSFFERHHLLAHIRVHNGERPFVCGIPDCAKSFHEKQKLKRHEKNVHLSKEGQG